MRNRGAETGYFNSLSTGRACKIPKCKITGINVALCSTVVNETFLGI